MKEHPGSSVSVAVVSILERGTGAETDSSKGSGHCLVYVLLSLQGWPQGVMAAVLSLSGSCCLHFLTSLDLRPFVEMDSGQPESNSIQKKVTIVKWWAPLSPCFLFYKKKNAYFVHNPI